jgi:hypothetical protein
MNERQFVNQYHLKLDLKLFIQLPNLNLFINFAKFSYPILLNLKNHFNELKIIYFFFILSFYFLLTYHQYVVFYYFPLLIFLKLIILSKYSFLLIQFLLLPLHHKRMLSFSNDLMHFHNLRYLFYIIKHCLCFLKIKDFLHY